MGETVLPFQSRIAMSLWRWDEEKEGIVMKRMGGGKKRNPPFEERRKTSPECCSARLECFAIEEREGGKEMPTFSKGGRAPFSISPKTSNSIRC